MRLAGFSLALAGIFAGNALGQMPTVGGLLNNYSFTLPGLPNYGIAEGSIFDIFGTNLASTTLPLQGPPLKTTLSGVTIAVTVNGTTTNPLIYFLSPGQIAAILPSATPVGTGTIAVTTSAGTSAAFPIQVVQSAFGLLTTNNGSGPLQGFDASNSGTLMSFSAAANPGDILELWGTGLGPTPGDATGVAVSPTAQVFIGGVAATVLYAGRSSYAGLDQINVKVPAGLSGCNVSVVVQTGTYLSNFATLPITASGRTCSDPSNPLTSAILNQISQTGTFSIGFILLDQTTTPATTVDGVSFGGGTTDTAFAGFSKYTYAQFNAGAYASAAGGASVGSCVVSFFNSSSTSTAPPPVFKITYLNAGPDINITAPGGVAVAMPLTSEAGIDVYTAPSTATSFIPATGGTFMFNNGSGGPDVGPFTTQLDMGSPLVWSNMASISTVTRSNGLTVNWTGGASGSYVSVTGLSFGAINGSSVDFVVGDFTCQAPVSAGTFTVPSAVLLSLPQSFTIAGISTSTLAVSNVTGPVTFTAQGLDLGLVEATVENTISVAYQ
jgi:uncharacterized protein (TIGR03437 family)